MVNQAVVIGIGVRETGEREVVGFAVGASEEQAFWLEFLRSLLARGLHAVQLVISDAHEGLKAAIGQVFAGATWQRCRVHCLRNLLAHVPQSGKAMVAAAVRTIFAQPNRQAAGQQPQEVVQALQSRLSTGGQGTRRGRGGRAGLHVLPAGALDPHFFHQCVRATEPRSQTAHGGRWGLS